MALNKIKVEMMESDMATQAELDAAVVALTAAIAASNVKLSGDVVKVAYAETLAQTSLSAAIPRDSTIPQVGEGTQVLSLAITPATIGNILQVDVIAFASEQANTGDIIAVALFQDGAANAVAVGQISAMGNGGNNLTTGYCLIRFRIAAASLAATTFTVRAGPDSGTAIFNGSTTTATYGLKTASSITITEIKA